MYTADGDGVWTPTDTSTRAVVGRPVRRARGPRYKAPQMERTHATRNTGDIISRRRELNARALTTSERYDGDGGRLARTAVTLPLTINTVPTETTAYNVYTCPRAAGSVTRSLLAPRVRRAREHGRWRPFSSPPERVVGLGTYTHVSSWHRSPVFHSPAQRRK